MNLIDALECLQKPVAGNARPLRVFLACGFTPLHLQTFLAAHLKKRFPKSKIEVKCGLYGDLVGNVERFQPQDHDALVTVVEWSDLDPRLGLRALGGWDIQSLPDIVNSANHTLERLGHAVNEKSSVLPAYLCLPTLPLPPVFSNGTMNTGSLELNLRHDLTLLAQSISKNNRVKVVSAQYLDEKSPLNRRFDLRAEITQGFPYRTAHASNMGEIFAEMIYRRESKKGLITDLDNTLWAGILGEVGVAAVDWHLEQNAQLHGIYQQLLASLASAGILIGAASKNDRDLVGQVFERNDLLISRNNVFPIEAHWRRKSESVQKILEQWNVLPESVVFVDDSPMEVAEVQQLFPEMECLVFPNRDYDAFWTLLNHLRNCFAKISLFDEDLFRLETIRQTHAFRLRTGIEQNSMDQFLQEAEGRLTFYLGGLVDDGRAFELINKTNQFNLNGKRYDRGTWSALFRDPRIQGITAFYEDRYGKLGKIAVIIGQLSEKRIIIESWVMSCRAFSRRIEHQCIQYLFEKFDVLEITFEVQSTARNGPMIEFLQQWSDVSVQGTLTLDRCFFSQKTPKLPHKVSEEVLR